MRENGPLDHLPDQPIPDQRGRIAVVTGASSGIGAEAALALAEAGARVVLAVRNPARGEAVRVRILDRVPGARVEALPLDLASLDGIRGFAARASGALPGIDILLNNAGLGLQPRRAETADGFERQFGTNHLGHFALTGLLLPALLRRPGARVVTISSIAHRRGRIDFDDLQGMRRYGGSRAYAQSKLANLMFALELDRRARAAGLPLASLAAHPGLAATGFAAATLLPPWQRRALGAGFALLGQSAARGAMPGLHAATAPAAKGGTYWGPRGFMEFRGDPGLAAISEHARDRAAWRSLWRESERLTGVRYAEHGLPPAETED